MYVALFTRYVPGLDPRSSPAVGSSLDGLLNRTALLDVLFRGMPREDLMYLAALDDPSLIDDPNSSVVLQAYPAYNMLEGGLTTFNHVGLSIQVSRARKKYCLNLCKKSILSERGEHTVRARLDR